MLCVVVGVKVSGGKRSGVRGGESESDNIEDVAKTAKLVWKNPGGAVGINCGMKNSLLIGAEGRVTIRDLAIEARD